MEKIKTHHIDFNLISKGLNLPVEDCIDFFDDGRIIGRYGEYVIKNHLGGEKTKENESYDVKHLCEKLEIRCITDKLSFASSKEVGYGRSVTKEGFEEKLRNIDSYVVIDKRDVNNLNFFKITKEEVIKLEDSSLLGKNKSISSKKIYKLLYGDK
jgi:hypothetical protein